MTSYPLISDEVALQAPCQPAHLLSGSQHPAQKGVCSVSRDREALLHIQPQAPQPSAHNVQVSFTHDEWVYIVCTGIHKGVRGFESIKTSINIHIQINGNTLQGVIC